MSYFECVVCKNTYTDFYNKRNNTCTNCLKSVYLVCSGIPFYESYNIVKVFFNKDNAKVFLRNHATDQQYEKINDELYEDDCGYTLYIDEQVVE